MILSWEGKPGKCNKSTGGQNKLHLPENSIKTIIRFAQSGRGAVRLARLHGVQEVGGSNPLAPTVTRKIVLLAGRFYFNQTPITLF